MLVFRQISAPRPMTPLKLLSYEGEGFLFLLSALLAYRLLTRQIDMTGLLVRKEGSPNSVSPERIQLLAATIAVCAKYLLDLSHATSNHLPDVPNQFLYLFGASSGAYATIKTAISLASRIK